MDSDDLERIERAIRAIEIASNPYLIFGFGGARSIYLGALDDIALVWNRHHPDKPMSRTFRDELLIGMKGAGAYLAR